MKLVLERRFPALGSVWGSLFVPFFTLFTIVVLIKKLSINIEF